MIMIVIIITPSINNNDIKYNSNNDNDNNNTFIHSQIFTEWSVNFPTTQALSIARPASEKIAYFQA